MPPTCRPREGWTRPRPAIIDRARGGCPQDGSGTLALGNPIPELHPESPGPPTTTRPGPSHEPTAPSGDCEESLTGTYPVTAMTASADRPQSTPTRASVGVEIPSGPAGLDLLMPALSSALEGTGPALALLPRAGSPAYRGAIRAAVAPGDPVPGDVAIVASTSGSTGNPTGVLLPGSALRAAARGFSERSGRPSGHRWVAALPLHHAGGLMVAVRAALVGTVPVATASLGGAEPFTVDVFGVATTRALQLSAVDDLPLAVSLVPPMLALLEAAGARGLDLLAEYDAVLVGGAATPAALVDRLRRSGVRIVTSYGMTETCGGAVLDGRALTGVSVEVDLGGRLTISGEQVAVGYRDGRDPHRWSTGPDGQRRFRTDDLGRVGPEGRVVVEGRVDDVVQVAGASVSLGAVRAVLEADPRVAAAEVVALPDPRWGSRLVAAVVTAAPGPTDAGESTALAADLADIVERGLGRAARPRAVHAVDALPALESGKVDRGAVLEWARDLDRISR
jgi:o-succinylbenzoate---CoA ligase